MKRGPRPLPFTSYSDAYYSLKALAEWAESGAEALAEQYGESSEVTRLQKERIRRTRRGLGQVLRKHYGKASG